MDSFIYSWFYIFTVFTSFFASLAAIKLSYEQDFPGRSGSILMFSGTAIWTFGTMFSSLPLSIQWNIFWNQIQIIGVDCTSIGMFLLAYWYTGLNTKIPKEYIRLVLVIPIITIIGIFTNPVHGLSWVNVSISVFGPLEFIKLSPSLLFKTHFVYSYILFVSSGLIVIRHVLLADFLYSDQSIAIVLSIIIPLSVNFLYHSKLIQFPLPPTQSVIFVAIIFVLYSYYRSNGFSHVPAVKSIGRKKIFENMNEGVIITDNSGIIVEVNKKLSYDFFNVKKKNIIGNNIKTILNNSIEDAGEKHTFKYEERYYEAKFSRLCISSSSEVGYLVLVRDVTHEKKKQEKLEVLNRTLRHNLRNSITGALGNIEHINSISKRKDYIENTNRIEKLANSSVLKLNEINKIGEKARRVEEMVERENIETTVENTDSILDFVKKKKKNNNIITKTDFQEKKHIEVTKLFKWGLVEAVENSIEHTNSERIIIDVKEKNDLIEFTIKDNGPGIPKHEIEVISKGSETDLSHSNGLGLWITKWSTEESNGELVFHTNDKEKVISIQIEKAGTNTSETND